MNEETKIKKKVNSPKKTTSTKAKTSSTKKTNSTKSKTVKSKNASTTVSKNTATKKRKVNKTTPNTKKKQATTPKKIETNIKGEIKPVVKKEVVAKESETIVKTVQPKDELFKLKVIALLLAVLLFVLLSFKSFSNLDDINTDKKYQKDNYQTSYLVNNNVTKVSCDELYSATTGEKSFIYVTGLGSEEEYKLEKKLNNVINDYHLKDEFYVYELNDNCRSTALSSLQLTSDFQKVPMILFYRDGVLQEQIARDDNEMLSDADLVKILDIYEIKK